MDSLTLKLILTPTLIGAASLAGRRWGQGVGGWLIALPLTSGPIVFFLALNQGTAFAHNAALGCLAGAIAQILFCLVYGRLALRSRWPLALLGSSLIFTLATFVLQYLILTLIPLFLLVIMTIILGLYLLPDHSKNPPVIADELPGWDIPARMIVVTAVVLLLTGIAPRVGPRLTGLLALFPLYGATMACFAHRLQGSAAAVGMLRGLLFGLFAFAGFFLVLAALMERTNIALSFTAAIFTALIIQAVSLWIIRRKPE
jgi:hypothetical protein